MSATAPPPSSRWDHGIARFPLFTAPAHPRRWRRPRARDREDVAAGQVRVGTRLTLVGDAHERLALERGARLAWRERWRFQFSVGHAGARDAGG
jgi:hypothetical protein